jgi:hypothetical protein
MKNHYYFKKVVLILKGWDRLRIYAYAKKIPLSWRKSSKYLQKFSKFLLDYTSSDNFKQSRRSTYPKKDYPLSAVRDYLFNFVAATLRNRMTSV